LCKEGAILCKPTIQSRAVNQANVFSQMSLELVLIRCTLARRNSDIESSSPPMYVYVFYSCIKTYPYHLVSSIAYPCSRYEVTDSLSGLKWILRTREFAFSFLPSTLTTWDNTNVTYFNVNCQETLGRRRNQSIEILFNSLINTLQSGPIRHTYQLDVRAFY
jgi:hypothetical protein